MFYMTKTEIAIDQLVEFAFLLSANYHDWDEWDEQKKKIFLDARLHDYACEHFPELTETERNSAINGVFLELAYLADCAEG